MSAAAGKLTTTRVLMSRSPIWPVFVAVDGGRWRAVRCAGGLYVVERWTARSGTWRAVAEYGTRAGAMGDVARRIR